VGEDSACTEENGLVICRIQKEQSSFFRTLLRSCLFCHSHHLVKDNNVIDTV
jgi:hypothetical protein